MSSAVSLVNVSKVYRVSSNRALADRTLKGALAGGVKRILEPRRQSGSSDFTALDDVSFEIAEGDAFGLIGPNGAGKSTLLKILARITAPTRGQVKIRGRVGSLLEVGTGFHPELSGRENIYLASAIHGMSAAEIRRHFDEIVDFSEVEAFLDLPVKHYSTGMYMKLAFSVAAHMEPDVLLVDEALAVGDLRFQRKCLARMHELAKHASAVVLVSHNHESIAQFCNRAAWLDRGRLLQLGSAEDVVAGYLGSMRTERPTTQWEGNAGDDTLRLLATYVRYAQGGQPDTAGDLIIGFRAEVLQPVANLVAAIEIRSDRGTLLAYSACDDAMPPPAAEIAAGPFAREVRIPANTLARGVYEASFDFGIHNERRIIDGPGTLTFELENTRGCGRRFPAAKWSGIFRPAWQWTKTDAP
jgi:lipopolysaccharide transport system ATP-binding protein